MEQEFSFIVPGPYDFDATLRARRFGMFDPTSQASAGHFIKAFATPQGPASVEARFADAQITGAVYGDGAPWLLERLGAMFGLHDEVPPPPKGCPPWLRARWREAVGVRMSRAPVLSESHVVWIFQQRVTYRGAVTSYRRLVERFGEPAPGPASGLFVPLTPRQWSKVPGHVGMMLDLDGQRYRAIQHAARAAAAVDAEQSPQRLRALLMGLPGTKAWTTESVMGFGFGDPDALPLGDVHLPHMVAKAFTGRPVPGTDEQMVQLLEPYRPNRFRVARLML